MIVMLLPASDYDPTEAAVPWSALHDAELEVHFATPDGTPAFADPRLVEQGFSVLSPLLMTRRAPLAAYRKMIENPRFLAPSAHADIDPSKVTAVFIPGGHASGMRTLLESEPAQRLVAHAMTSGLPVGAVCHGVLVAARAADPSTGRSVLYGRRTTALPALFELSGWNLTRMWLGRYYRTYDRTVEAEVSAALACRADFEAGPVLPRRDTHDRLGRGFTVQDGAYISARWPGDCHRLARQFLAMIQAQRLAELHSSDCSRPA